MGNALMALPNTVATYLQLICNLLLPLNVTTGESSLFTFFSPTNYLLAGFNHGQEIHTLSKTFFPSTLENNIITSGEEYSSNSRRQRSSTPVVGYSFKVGDFYPSTTI